MVENFSGKTILYKIYSNTYVSLTYVTVIWTQVKIFYVLKFINPEIIIAGYSDWHVMYPFQIRNRFLFPIWDMGSFCLLLLGLQSVLYPVVLNP